MNKKLFTLAAGLLLGSAFTVNAQTNELDNDTKLDGTKWYYIGVKGTEDDHSDRRFLKGEKSAETKVTQLVGTDNVKIDCIKEMGKL